MAQEESLQRKAFGYFEKALKKLEEITEEQENEFIKDTIVNLRGKIDKRIAGFEKEK